MTAGSRVLQAQAPRPSAFSAHDWRYVIKKKEMKLPESGGKIEVM